MRKIVLIGDGGHAKVVKDMITENKGYVLHAILDDKYKEFVEAEGIIRGPVNAVYGLMENDPKIKIVIAIGSNLVRKKIVDYLNICNNYFETVIHRTAVISPSATIGAGTVVMPGTLINAETKIGNHVIINTGSVVEHDCIVEDYAHISPRTVLTGGVTIEEGAQVGAGATVIPQKTVGKWSIVGAGAVVNKNVKEKSTAVGIPAKELMKEGLPNG